MTTNALNIIIENFDIEMNELIQNSKTHSSKMQFYYGLFIWDLGRCKVTILVSVMKSTSLGFITIEIS